MTHWGSQVRVLYSPFNNTASHHREAVVLRDRTLVFSRRTTTKYATLAQLIEQLICNLQVLGLSPRGGFTQRSSPLDRSRRRKPKEVLGRVSKRPKGGDCKSSCVSIRWFESTRAHSLKSPFLDHREGFFMGMSDNRSQIQSLDE